eukprot:CAMPEP_0119375646 /NCGR_PEP_ID=MMETSP1334-20130426/36527_1 /TAXON_ID=127549 /ORGANISM="Calcidiscus leptoporus, Strain RCC1130" /LENGTH=332 /DNA_ID=CAMNT_0007394011 /DNA_START=26 /DNA_END=1021 /DNA_ORIENTATION=-
MASASFAFKEEQAVYAYHGPLLYKATIKECVSRTAPGGSPLVKLYLVSYDGVNQHWDEWVPESRVLADTKEAEKLQKERIKEFNRAVKKRARAATEQQASSSAPPHKKRMAEKGAPSDKNDEMLINEIKETLRLPQAMKLRLIDDWERISRERKLVPLPRDQTIATLLDDFVATKAKRTSHERLYTEVCDGMRSFFNQALPQVLLYKYERKQMRDVRDEHKEKTYVELYGAEHMLRLFVKLPELLVHCKLQREHMSVLLSKLTELLKFMQAHKSKYFANAFESPSEEYLQWWSQEEAEGGSRDDAVDRGSMPVVAPGGEPSHLSIEGEGEGG